LDRVRSPLPMRFNVALAGAAVLAVSVVYADYRVAVICRQAAAQLARLPSPGTVWFGGHSSFQYYMEENGAQILDAKTPQFHPGDLVVLPVHNYGATPGGHGFKFVEVKSFGSSWWLTTAQSEMGAGFYCSFGL